MVASAARYYGFGAVEILDMPFDQIRWWCEQAHQLNEVSKSE